MHPKTPSFRRRIFHTALVLLGTSLLGSCADGKDPAGVLGESHFRLTLEPALLPELVPDEVRPIERIRITAEEASTGSFLGGSTFRVEPEASEWTLDFSLAIRGEATVVAVVSVELISLSTGSELVEWSGRSGSITLRVGVQSEISDLPLVKGPLANLGVIGVTIQEGARTILEGQSTQLTASASTTTPQDPPTFFWRSLNPGVATVSGSGLVRGVLPGVARIVATAGNAADTATITVAPRPGSVELTPEGAVLDALGDEVVFEARVLDPRGEVIPDEGVTWSVADPQVLQELGGGGYRAIGRGSTLVRAASLLDPTVVGSADVVVRQVVAAVDVLPGDTVIFIGESSQFQATALDANGNPIEGMGFSWSTPNTGVASLTDTGLASGIGAGTATILAQALSPALGVNGAEGAMAPTPGTTGRATLEVLPEVARVVITPNPFTFRSLGENRQFTAQAQDASGNPLPLTNFSWASGNTGVVRVNSTGLATSVANGSTVVRATVRGVTGTAAVFVSQAASSYAIVPSSWQFVCVVGAGCQAKDFQGRAYDALGSVVPGVEFYWYSTEYCFDITNPIGKPASTATVQDNCGCDTSPGFLEARVNPDSLDPDATAYLTPPPCLMAGLGQAGTCPLSFLPAGSPFRLGVRPSF